MPQGQEIRKYKRLVEEQCLEDPALLCLKGFKTLTGLEQARLCAPRSPALTAPEWELLAEFGLYSKNEIRQRMNERAMLAAYDGAPNSLTEMHVERSPAATGSGCGPSRKEPHIEARQEAVLEARLDYNPEGSRASLRYVVTWRHCERTTDGQSLNTESSRFHAVLFDVLTGGVVQRENGTIRRGPGQLTARRDVVWESATQPIRYKTGLRGNSRR